MEKKKKLLEVKDLKTHFFIEKEVAKAVNGVSFDIFEGETLGIVGESGSGKSVTALSILRLIPDPPGKIVCGEINFRGRDLLKLSWGDVRKVRGNEISMIFQEPMTSLNPVFTIGSQIMEPILLHQKISHEEAKAKAVEMMELVGIPSSVERFDDFPHQFSGGMRQRVMIAMALACNPNLLIADEPTTALDVTIQAQILDLMADIRKKKPESAMMLITHDLAVVAEICSRVIVMYCGRIQEVADTVTLFKEPLHPYTVGLMESIPSLDTKKDRLYTIPGNVPSIMNLPQGCSFCTRCSKKMDICEKVLPDLVEIKPGHQVRCHLYSKSSEVK
ncbi:MAG: ABC transporter ATP-binding protein [Candidatus Muirbacterium halophilum]|nr:ABC transporter ATP-binding protein [Candidatus Muirbacterium halophilum]